MNERLERLRKHRIFTISKKFNRNNKIYRRRELQSSFPGFPNYETGTLIHSFELPEPPPEQGFSRHKACFRVLIIEVDNLGNVIDQNQIGGNTTTNLNLLEIIQTNNLIPQTAGSYTFIFEFFGWRKPGDPPGWYSSDTKYDVYRV